MYSQVHKEENTTNERTDFGIFYTHDGKELADCIQQRLTDKRFACSVKLINFSEFSKNIENDNPVTNCKSVIVYVLIVSPSLLSYAESSSNISFDTIFEIPQKTVVLYFYVDMRAALKSLGNMCVSASKWTHKDIGRTTESLRECFITLLTILEEDHNVSLPVLKKYTLIPSTLSANTDKVYMMFAHETRGKVQVVQGDDSQEAVFYNPFTYIFTPQCHYSGSSEIEVFVDHTSAGRATLHYTTPIQELEQCLTSAVSPLDLLCSAVLGESCSVGVLDQTLVHMYCNSDSPVFQPHQLVPQSEDVCNQEVPTLLHFGAKFGLKQFCEAIMKTTGGRIAVSVKNKDGLTPIGVALKHKHQKLAKALRLIRSDSSHEEKDVEAHLEPYCDMKADAQRCLRAVKSTGHYDVINDHDSAVPEVQRSISVPANVEASYETYMEMEFVKKCKVKNAPDAKQEIFGHQDVKRRPKKANRENRESARISLIMEEEIPFLPRPLQRQERIYTSIRQVAESQDPPPVRPADTFRTS